MQTVNFIAMKDQIQQLTNNNAMAMCMRNYKYVSLDNYERVDELLPFELELLKNVESLCISGIEFRDTNECVALLKHCRQLKAVIFQSSQITSISTEPIEKIQNPMSIQMSMSAPALLDCFTHISQIHIRNQQDMERLLSHHAVAITSLELNMVQCDSETFLQLLVSTPELKLKHLRMDGYMSKYVELKAQLLAQQKPYLTSLSMGGTMSQPLMLDVVRLNLFNLETLEFSFRRGANIHPNDLHVLPRLNSLEIGYIVDLRLEDSFELDIEDLLSLKQLKLNIWTYFTLSNPSPPPMPLNRLELRLPFSSLIILELTIERIPLQNVCLALEINKLINLQSLTIGEQSNFQFINDSLVAALRLPILRKFCVYKVRIIVKHLKNSRNNITLVWGRTWDRTAT
jgi:hypothetical protein